MKKNILNASLFVILISILTLNIGSYGGNIAITSMKNNSTVIKAPEGKWVNCDNEGGVGIPFFDRCCSDCALHFNDWYSHSECFKASTGTPQD